jgi:hypothetical protein
VPFVVLHTACSSDSGSGALPLYMSPAIPRTLMLYHVHAWLWPWRVFVQRCLSLLTNSPPGW